MRREKSWRSPLAANQQAELFIAAAVPRALGSAVAGLLCLDFAQLLQLSAWQLHGGPRQGKSPVQVSEQELADRRPRDHPGEGASSAAAGVDGDADDDEMAAHAAGISQRWRR